MNLLCILRSGLCGLGVLVFLALRALEPEILFATRKALKNSTHGNNFKTSGAVSWVADTRNW